MERALPCRIASLRPVRRKETGSRSKDALHDALLSDRWWESPAAIFNTWKTIQYPAPNFPVPYHPNHVPLVYNGKPMKLTPVQEQMVYPVYRRWDKMNDKEKQNWLESFRQLSGLKSDDGDNNANGSENANDSGNADDTGNAGTASREEEEMDEKTKKRLKRLKEMTDASKVDISAIQAQYRKRKPLVARGTRYTIVDGKLRLCTHQPKYTFHIRGNGSICVGDAVAAEA